MKKQDHSAMNYMALAILLAATGCVSTPDKAASAEPAKVDAAKTAARPTPAPAAKTISGTEQRLSESAVTLPATAAVADTPPPVVAVPAASAAVPAGPKRATSQAPGGSATAMPLSESDIKQKLQYAGVLFMSKSYKRVAASNHAEAKGLLEQAKQKLADAKTALGSDKLTEAAVLADESMRLFNNASRLVPSEDMLSEQKNRYQGLLKELETAKQSHKQNFDRMVAKKGASGGVKYDANQVAKLTAESEALANKGDFEKAGDAVAKAEGLITGAISQMLAGQEIVYQLNIDTPEGEFKYELDRYLGYEELIPIAIENKQPNEGQMTLIKTSADKGKWMAEEARKKAAEGDYPLAIRMIMDATEKVRSALRVLGVNQ